MTTLTLSRNPIGSPCSVVLLKSLRFSLVSYLDIAIQQGLPLKVNLLPVSSSNFNEYISIPRFGVQSPHFWNLSHSSRANAWMASRRMVYWLSSDNSYVGRTCWLNEFVVSWFSTTDSCFGRIGNSKYYSKSKSLYYRSFSSISVTLHIFPVTLRNPKVIFRLFTSQNMALLKVSKSALDVSRNKFYLKTTRLSQSNHLFVTISCLLSEWFYANLLDPPRVFIICMYK